MSRVGIGLLSKLIAAAGMAALPWAPLGAQIEGQPPVEACKPGDFTVIGFPDEFGPKADAGFRVLIDERFDGNFLTTNPIWVPAIEQAIESWNGIAGSTWSFERVGITADDPDDEDGQTTVAACGFQFNCPGEPPTRPPGDPPPGIPSTVAPQTTLAVTLVFSDLSVDKAIVDSDVFFNPTIPFWTEPNNAQIDFESVVVHELGHVLGLGHNDNCVVGPTVMESIIDLGERRRNLFEAETEGVKYLYPDSSQPAIRVFDSESVVRFETAEGAASPFPQTVRIFGTRGGRWLSTASQPWVTVEPPTGRFLSDGEIDIGVDTSQLQPGDHQAIVELNLEGREGEPARIQVELHIEAAPPVGVEPKLTRQGIVNGANFLSQSLAPGSIFTLFGQRFSDSTAQAGSFPLPTTLAGTRVLVNTVPAPLLFVSPNQINGQVPFEAAEGRGGIIVITGLGRTDSIPVDFAQAAPELFLMENDQAVVLNSDFTLNTPENPAEQGSKVSIFFSGQGPVDPPVPSGRPAPVSPLSSVASQASVEIGGLEANVFFIGLTPGFAGLAQADVEVPTGLFRQLPVRITIAGAQSNMGFISVKE